MPFFGRGKGWGGGDRTQGGLHLLQKAGSSRLFSSLSSPPFLCEQREKWTTAGQARKKQKKGRQEASKQEAVARRESGGLKPRWCRLPPNPPLSAFGRLGGAKEGVTAQHTDEEGRREGSMTNESTKRAEEQNGPPRKENKIKTRDERYRRLLLRHVCILYPPGCGRCVVCLFFVSAPVIIKIKPSRLNLKRSHTPKA